MINTPYLYKSSLSHKDLIDIEQDVTSLDNHPLDGEVFTDIFSLGDLI